MIVDKTSKIVSLLLCLSLLWTSSDFAEASLARSPRGFSFTPRPIPMVPSDGCSNLFQQEALNPPIAWVRKFIFEAPHVPARVRRMVSRQARVGRAAGRAGVLARAVI